MELTVATAVVGSACAIVGGVIGALAALYGMRGWAESRFRAAAECDRTHEATSDAVAGIRQSVATMGDRVEGLAVQVATMGQTVAVLGERVSGAFGRFDEVVRRLDTLVTTGCPYGRCGKEG